LRTGLFLGAAAVIWRGTEAMSAAAGLGGATRRFTGSRPAASFSGNDFPSNSWLLDSPKPLDLTAWHLSVSGAVKESFVLSHDDLEELDTIVATIDCTGGWFSTQQWTGVSLERLLARAAPARHARSVVIRSATGYWRRLPLDSSGTAVLASKVGGERLTHEHGSPARLVVPGSRGYDWVKWVTSIEVSAAPPWWKWPLPLS